MCPKLQLKWEGPYLILKKLSDVVYRIQRSKGAKPRVVHVDRLKPYQGDPIDPWNISKIPVGEHETIGTGREESGSWEDKCEKQKKSSVSHPAQCVQDAPREKGRYPKREHRLPLRYR